MIPFKNCSYLSQVRRLRKLAEKALKNYPVNNFRINFINHGENTTYKIVTNKKNYLLRIHRENYHTKLAIKEELNWLIKLGYKTNVPVQKPVKGKTGEFVYLVKSSETGDRYVDLLEWTDGYIRRKPVVKNFYELGKTLGVLHSSPVKSRHRIYWNTEGLIGKTPTFGSISGMKAEYGSKIDDVEKLKNKIKRRLFNYEKKYPDKMSLIHADMHFRNVIWNKKGASPIDFDDSGYGFQMYDLAVPLNDISFWFRKRGINNCQNELNSFFEGYSSHKELTQDDLKILLDLLKVRDIVMLGWLYDRKDNPSLKKYLDKHFKEIINEILDEDFYLGMVPIK